MGILRLEVDDILMLKKAHPCGSREWKIIRVGVDIGIKCLGCGRFVMVPRRKLEGKVRGIKRRGVSLLPQESMLEV
ncbi:MAG: DUF951 domain-containing protein [Candidatus Caldatribacteriaceae bacterium]